MTRLPRLLFAGHGTLFGVFYPWVNLYPEERQLRLPLFSFSPKNSDAQSRVGFIRARARDARARLSAAERARSSSDFACNRADYG